MWFVCCIQLCLNSLSLPLFSMPLLQSIITLPVTQHDSLLTLAVFRPDFRPEQLITMFCDGTSFVAQQVAEQLMQDQQGSPHNARAHLAGLARVGADSWVGLARMGTATASDNHIVTYRLCVATVIHAIVKMKYAPV